VRRVTRTPAPTSLDGPNSKGGKELEKATAFFSVRANRQRAFNFSAYKADDVRDAMRAMFHRKCAYCETFYAPAMPDDVEHYRPKGAYIERGKPRKPGYWWLAMAWPNLLPSCADCNRARKQRIAGTEGKATAGKANQFPLAAGSVRAADAAGIAAEVPLLLDPTADDPEMHLEFLPNGIVRPTVVAGMPSERGRVTIDVVALLRWDLVDARKVAGREAEVAIAHVRQTMDDIAFLTSEERITKETKEARLAVLRARLERDVADMEAKADPETPYSAVAEALVRAFKAEKGL
jgi:uncharacterized protein (TIGR02646 family)